MNTGSTPDTIVELPFNRRKRYAKSIKEIEKEHENFEMPVRLGDYVYYLTSNSEIVIEKGKVVGFDLRGYHIRINVDFGDKQLAILTEVIGVRLFLNEEDAKKELEKWTKNN